MKKLAGFMVLLSFLFVFSAACADGSPSPAVRSITASSDYNNNLPGKAADGKDRTRWESEWKNDQWLQVEFEEPVTLSGIRIKWETASAYTYKILGSLDGAQWQALAEVSDGNEGEDIRINFKRPAECKFIKIDCADRATAWGFSIWEMEFNTGKPYKNLPKRVSIPKGKKFFKVEKKGDKYWLVDPSGRSFISKGVNVVLDKDGAVLQNSQYYDVSEKYKSREDWAKDAVKRLKKWKFNTIGSWSDAATYYYDLPFTVMLGIPSTTDHRLVDVFDPMFIENVEATVASKCKRFRDAKYLIGYYVDNELPWYGDVGWYTGHAPLLLDEYSRLPDNAPGRKKLEEFLQCAYGKSIDDFMKVRGAQSREAREQFAGLVADEYFSVICDTIRKYDPNHLILGVRFACNAPDGVARACGENCDIVSVNYYCKNMKVDRQLFDNYYFICKKPIMITEFSYRAMENRSGDKNTKGADVTVKTQADRATGFDKYVTQVMEFPYLVGYHWFDYFDQSPQGRSFDGENSNYGIVDIYDKEYEILTEQMKKTNKQADTVHKKSELPYPDKAVSLSGYAPVNNKPVARPSAPFCDISALNVRRIGIWADGSSAAGFKLSKETCAEGAVFLKCEVTTGSGWGCGFNIPCDLKVKNGDTSVDLQGYKGMKIKMSVSSNLPFSLFMNESGANELGKLEYKGVKGADGESFSSEPNVGDGVVMTYDYPFDQFMIRTIYGNQSGNKTVDLQAIRNFDLYFPGNSGDGTCEIYEVTLY